MIAGIPDPPHPSIRLTFSRWDIREDADRLAFFLMCCDPEVMKYVDPERRYASVPDIVSMLEKDPPFEAFGYGFWIVRLRETGQVIGTCGIKRREILLQDEPREAMEAIEFGYLYKRQFWGQGFATEAATAVVHWGDDAGLETLWARVLAPHHKSMHVLRKVGFQFHQFGPASLDHEHIFRRPRWGAK